MATASHWAVPIAVVGAAVALSSVVPRAERDVHHKVQMPAIPASIAPVGAAAMAVANAN
ncbi:hypothetical protein ABLN87_19720 [Ruegeria sp. SCPT10]|uniref:hypothetical protein n=1 Tax=Ruegeria sp. SCP10 TaxID=3141377 RepID=UPI00333BCE6D